MTTRKYSSRSQQTTLTGAITAGATAMTVVSGTALLGGVTIPAGTTFTLVLDPDTAIEEIVDATAVSTNTFTITRAIDGSTAQAHSAGGVVRHMAIGRDYRDANLHTEADSYYNDGSGTGHTMHGINSGEGVVVGTLKTQTLTNKTLTSPTITDPTITGTASAGAVLVFEGATADAYETTLTVVDPTQDNTVTIPNTTGTVVLDSATQTLTNKTLTSPTISGSPVITGLSSAGMISSSATPKDYVDSILGSATAAATSAASAATSAASAATSATSAAASATASAASASASATSASAAATSATNAAASATAAATSASSAATSATSAAASATTAANSVAAIAAYATTASNSASAAATSASSAATSAASAATSASTMAASVTAAATSAASAATSATSAAASATAAATSASNAAASATAAATSATSAAASATTAANSVAAIAGYATTASDAATAASTSATSAAASATAAATSASSAATSASSAATSASSAATSASSAAASFDQFDDIYLGAKSSPPSVDNDGNALQTGALYWNTSVNKMYVWSGSAWGEISSSADIIAYKYTATASQTSVSGADDNGLTLSYVVGKEQVYINGVLQVRGSDYTATTGSSITGMTALAANDIVTVLAFTAFSVANTIGISTLSAKGNILTASASSTPAVIAVGSNDQVLVADSSTSTGLAWKSYGAQSVAGKNAVINGGFDIWQRGTSVSVAASTSTPAYTADRWCTVTAANQAITVSRQATGDTTNLPNIQYALRYQRNSGQTGTNTLNLITNLESSNSIPFAGKTVTVSFYARAGANYSTTASALPVYLYSGTGTDQNAFVVYTGIATVANTNVTLTTTWQRFTFTGTVGTTATELALAFAFTPTGTAGAADYFEITGVQLELGSSATPFSRAGGNIQAELAACQRYYVRWGGDKLYQPLSSFGTAYTNNVVSNFTFPVQMRTVPTSVEYSTLAVSDVTNTPIAVTNVTLGSNDLGNKVSQINFAATGVTVYRPYQVITNNSLSGYLGLSAEL